MSELMESYIRGIFFAQGRGRSAVQGDIMTKPLVAMQLEEI